MSGPPSSALQPGTRVGAYEVLEALGSGASGAVARARGPDGRIVALKVLHRADEQALARFERERRLLATLGEAEGFVPLLDAGRSAAGPFIAMGYVDGGTLADRISRAPLEVGEARVLGVALARAMGVAHARGIVHRDLKPANILLRRDGRPLVADLGLAKHFLRDVPGAEGTQDLTRSNTLQGSRGYMPPEQLGDSRSVGPAADVFALGVVLYRCLTGAMPYAAPSLVELVLRMQRGTFVPVRTLRPGVPASLARTVERCLSHAPGDRFADGAELALALERTAPRARVLRVPLPVACLVAAALLGTGALAMRAAWPAPPRPAAPPAPPRPAAPPAPPPPPPAARDPRMDALALAKGALAKARLDPEGALDDARRAVALDPTCALARLARARSSYQLVLKLILSASPPEERILAEVRAARADVEEAVRLDPSSAEALALRGGLRMLSNEHAAAEADLDRALDLDPRDVDANIYKATLLMDRPGGLERAASLVATALEVDPGRSTSWGVSAILNERRGRRGTALADLATAIDRDPRNASAYALRAKIHFEAGRADDAVADAERAIALFDVTPTPWFVRGSVRAVKGDLRRALADLDTAVRIAPRTVPFVVVRGRLHVKLGDTARARADFTRAIELDATGPDAYDERAALCEREGDVPGAIADSKDCVRVGPSSAAAARSRERLARLERK